MALSYLELKPLAIKVIEADDRQAALEQVEVDYYLTAAETEALVETICSLESHLLFKTAGLL